MALGKLNGRVKISMQRQSAAKHLNYPLKGRGYGGT